MGNIIKDGELTTPPVTADSYATYTEGNTYFAQRWGSFADAWDKASTANKSKALNHATAIIDRLNFLGNKTDDDQTNQFPRGTETTVPQDIKDACCEIAGALLDDVDIEQEMHAARLTGTNYGGVRTTYDATIPEAHILAGVPSRVAWQLLLPYLRDPHKMNMTRA